MFFSTVNIAKELAKEKTKHSRFPQRLIGQVNELLSNEANKEQNLLNNAKNSGGLQEYDITLLQQNKIFSIDEIRNTCIKFRLRFLDFKLFCGELPYEAVMEMKGLEKRLGKPLINLKVIAPSALFELADKDSDPLLLLSLGNDKYYLIHKWGSDMKWYRKWISFPFRSLHHYIATIVFAAICFAQVVPLGPFPDNGSLGVFSIYRWYIFAFTLICLCSLSVLLLFTFRKNFSDQEWKNMYI